MSRESRGEKSIKGLFRDRIPRKPRKVINGKV